MGITKVRLTKADIIAAVRDENYGDSDLSNFANLSGSGLIERKSEGVIETVPVTDYIKTLLNDATAADARSTMGLGSMATASTSSYQPIGNELTALQALVDVTGFLKKTGDGTYSIDNNNYLPLSGGTVTGVTTFSNATPSTSTTTGAVVVSGGVGVGGAIFAGSYNLIPIGRGGGNGNVDTNTVMGVNAGVANTTGSSNSFLGAYAGVSNTTGVNNSFVGVSAGFANTAGSRNSFLGVNAGVANTTGSSNSFLGVNAGFSNTTGSSNSFVGVSAGLANTTGSSNSFLGVNAGRFIANGVTGLTVIDNSCYFGMNTKGTENAINENVFGYNATGNGSNTVTIGDNSITNTYLRGVISTNSTAASTSPTTGASVIPGGQGIGGNQHVAGFTSLGGTAGGHPAIKLIRFSGTTGASQGSVTNIAHNLTLSKIIGVLVFLKIDSGYFIPPGFTEVAGYLYTWSIYLLNFNLRLSGSSSASILSKGFEVCITYME